MDSMITVLLFVNLVVNNVKLVKQLQITVLNVEDLELQFQIVSVQLNNMMNIKTKN